MAGRTGPAILGTDHEVLCNNGGPIPKGLSACVCLDELCDLGQDASPL